MKIFDILEAFTDLGKLSNEDLVKGKPMSPNTNGNFNRVDGRVFHRAISRIRMNDIARMDQARGLDTLTIYSVKEYNGMTCYLGKNNSSGYALHGDELVSVFSTQGSSGNAIVQDAINNGASRLDCFATRNQEGNIEGQLYSLYRRNGFRIDTSMNSGDPSEPYSIQNGVSSFVDEKGIVRPEDSRVVIFMSR